MFKKFKDKLAEEMKQSPARLQASMQQLAQVGQLQPQNSLTRSSVNFHREFYNNYCYYIYIFSLGDRL